jgi:UDP-N-acetylglucosamine 2-epimerase (non-hydrolysing)
MNIYFFIGTTAELIKISPVIKELKKRKIKFKLITSGQGKILFPEFYDYLGTIKADISFKYKGEKSSVFHFTLWAIQAFFSSFFYFKKEFLKLNKSDTYFIVHGDTVSSLIGALIASFYKLKVVHIESGLRSYNFFEPFPEEISRYIISRLTSINFCPNLWCVGNLEKVKGVKINTFQNTLIEIFQAAAKKNIDRPSVIKTLKKYFVLVIHRQEHLIFGKNQTREIFRYVLENKRSLSCVLIMHQLTVDFLKSIGSDMELLANQNVIPVPRLPYPEFMKLIKGAQYLVTDGGSNQEEAYYMGKPCLLLRKHTERIEGLGENVILSKLNKQIIKHFQDNYRKYNRSPILSKISPAKIIVDYLTFNAND